MGDSLRSKTEAISQAGVYGVGQLTRSQTNKIVVLVLFKDKSAQVASASLGDASSPVGNSIGEVSYKFVARVDSMSLKVKEELQEFARILVSALKWTLCQT